MDVHLLAGKSGRHRGHTVRAGSLYFVALGFGVLHPRQVVAIRRLSQPAWVISSVAHSPFSPPTRFGYALTCASTCGLPLPFASLSQGLASEGHTQGS
jgi:hypothetical protein